MGFALVALGSLPAAASAAEWRLIDKAAACYYQLRSEATVQCRAIATFERPAGDRMVCAAFARRHPGPMGVECESKPPGYLPEHVDYRHMPSLTSAPPYEAGFADTEWQIDGDRVVGCIIPREKDQPICSSAPARP